MAALIHRVSPAVRAEFRRLFFFGTIGVLALGMTVGLYAIVSRWVWPGGPHTIQYTLVVIFMTWVNYEANSRFTFDRTKRSVAAMGRFAGVAVIATGLNSFFFWLGHEVFHLLDFTVIIATTFLVAAFTFTSHRAFTFHDRPWRFFGKP